MSAFYALAATAVLTTVGAYRGSRASEPIDLKERAGRFFDDYKAETTPSSTYRGERVFDFGAATELSWWNDRVEINSIRALTPKQGAGTRGLRRVLDLARKHGLEVELDAVPVDYGHGVLSTRKLVAWYRKHGFRYDSPRNEGGRLVWKP